ncbi:MAG: LysR family transcriptional regulator [Roseivivax sp.]|nr:LysR family transcriptional regulator [Roseivivax sp.]
MIRRNLRHLRVFLAVADLGSLTQASAACNISQPAATQAIKKLEAAAGGLLFQRASQGVFLTERGALLAERVRRAFARLDPALSEISQRLPHVASAPQLEALAEVAEAESFTLAARRLGLAQPTVHRAVSQLEKDCDRPLLRRTPQGLVPSRACRALADAVRLAFSEFDQAMAELAVFDGREAGRIVIGALPLSRSALLPQALIGFRARYPNLPIHVVDGPYGDLLAGLRRGALDVIVGALRDPVPVADVVQEPLMQDKLAIVARPGHPLASARGLTAAALAAQSWVVPREGSPTRVQFDAFFAGAQVPAPASVIESGSILLMREVLNRTDFLGCISDAQARVECDAGLLTRLEIAADWAARPIGLTYRADWMPTRAQAHMLELLRDGAREQQAMPRSGQTPG